MTRLTSAGRLGALLHRRPLGPAHDEHSAQALLGYARRPDHPWAAPPTTRAPQLGKPGARDRYEQEFDDASTQSS
jgi:hypothetical protein